MGRWHDNENIKKITVNADGPFLGNSWKKSRRIAGQFYRGSRIVVVTKDEILVTTKNNLFSNRDRWISACIKSVKISLVPQAENTANQHTIISETHEINKNIAMKNDLFQWHIRCWNNKLINARSTMEEKLDLVLFSTFVSKNVEQEWVTGINCKMSIGLFDLCRTTVFAVTR